MTETLKGACQYCGSQRRITKAGRIAKHTRTRRVVDEAGRFARVYQVPCEGSGELERH
jgi:hypothetical protein